MKKKPDNISSGNKKLPDIKKIKAEDTFKIKNQYLYMILAGILAYTFILYSRSINFEFVNWDDTQFFIDNTFIRNFSWDGIKDIFNSPYKGDYQPLATLSWLIEYKLFGLEPEIFHRTNLIFHLANIILVFILINLLTKNNFISIFVSFFFAIHPLHVESVAWNSERKDVMYSLFFLLSMITYLRYLKSNYKLSFLICSFLMYCCSALSKSMAVTLPLILLLFDYHFHRKILTLKVLVEKIPFFIVSIIIGIVTLHSQKNIIPDLTISYSFINRIFLVLYSFSFYIIQLALPFNLSILHHYPKVNNGFLPVEFYLSSLFILLTIWFLIKQGKNKNYLYLGLLFFVITLLPVIQVIPVGMAIVSERYTYLTSIGLFTAVLTSVAESGYYHRYKRYVFVLMLFCSVYYSVYTWNRIQVWQNGMTLWGQYVEKNPDFFYGYFALGGNLEKEKKYIDEIQCLDKCISLNPAFDKAYNDRGKARFFLGNNKGALDDFSIALSINPKSFETLNNRGWIYFSNGKFPEAIADYKAALSINSNSLLVLKNLAWTYYSMKNYDEAIIYYDSALKVSITDAVSYHYRGMSYLNLNKINFACMDWNKASELGYHESGAWLAKYCR